MEAFEDFLDHGGIVEPVDTIPDPYREAVFRFIELHANSELMGGLTERDWIPRTPGLRHKMKILAKTQDEIGHGHLLYMVAADLGIKSRSEMLEDLFAVRCPYALRIERCMQDGISDSTLPLLTDEEQAS